MMHRTKLALAGIGFAVGSISIQAASAVETDETDAPIGAEAAAEDTQGTEGGGGADVAAPAAGGLGLSLSLDIVSTYSFRGWNVFQDESQKDQPGMIAPGVYWYIGDTGVWLGYWGAYQLSGEYRGPLVDEGVGAEQDLMLGYDRELADGDVALSAMLLAYVFPLADPEAAGVAWPTFLEPMLTAKWSSSVDLGLELSYLFNIQPEVAGYAYLYLHPTVSKTFELSDSVELETGLAIGYKVFTQLDVWEEDRGGTSSSGLEDNAVDVAIDLTLPIYAGSFYVTPGLHAVWTNLSYAEFGEEFFVWGGVTLGADL